MKFKCRECGKPLVETMRGGIPDDCDWGDPDWNKKWELVQYTCKRHPDVTRLERESKKR